MSDFLINPKGLKTLDGSFDGTELKIREIQSEIRHVRNNLSFDSIGAIAIKAYLHFQIMNLGLLNNDFSNYHESLKQISTIYNDPIEVLMDSENIYLIEENKK